MASINVRTDEPTDQALAELTATGITPSEAIRAAVQLAARHLRQQRLREQAEQLRNDPAYIAEIRAVQADMEPLRAW